MIDRFEAFLEKIESKINFKENDAFLITSTNNRFYFSGLFTSDGLVLITKKKIYFLIDFRYYELARRQTKGIDVILVKDFFETLGDLINKLSIKDLYLESKDITLFKFKFLKSALGSLDVKLIFNDILSETIEELRCVKNESEIKKIATAQEISEFTFNYILTKIKPGISEKEIAAEIEYFMKKNGAKSTSFDTIVLSGKNSSLPHGLPTNKKVEIGDFITIDMGAVFEGYCSDMTRTVALGKVTDEQRQVYETVKKAQKIAETEVKAGVSCAYLDNLARDYIYSQGFEGKFGHALGHGVGIDIHERPVVSKKSDAVLAKDMVITIEPGIYIEDKFGVRIEDMLRVEQNGYYNFTKLTKDLIIL